MAPHVEGLSDPVEIGRGGFGIVYKARDDRFDREVALKVIRDPGLSDEVVARFARECKSLGSLSGHPNIVAIHDAGQTDEGELYLTMEHLPRGSLAQRVADDGPADPAEVLAWGAALAGALETAHRGGIVHRDVKPENVLFSSFGSPKLVDFGIARMRTAFETRSGSVSATLSHAAPEIIGGKPATAHADVYSLASVLFFALTGQAPFDRPDEESLAPLIARIATADPPDLRDSGVPDALAAVVERGLAKDPEARHASAADFGHALQEAASELGMPVPEMPISDVEPVGPLFEGAVSRHSTPRLGTVQVGRRRDAAPVTTTTPAARKHSRRMQLLVAALLVLALTGAGIGYATTREGTPEEAADAGLHLEDPVMDGEGLRVARSYDVVDDGSRVSSSVRLTNTSGAESKFVWFEIIPAELADAVDDIRFTVPPGGAIDGELIVYWVFTLPPGGEQPLEWSTALPAGAEPTVEYLREVKALVERDTLAKQPLTAAKRAELAAATGAEATAPAPLVPPDSSTSGGGGDVPVNGGGDVPDVLAGDAGTGTNGGALPAPDAGDVTTGGSATGSGSGGGSSGGGSGGGAAPAAPAPAPDPAPAPAPAANRAPVVSASNQSNSENQGVSVTFSASDPDGGTPRISVSGLPAGLSASGGRVTGTISHSAASVTTHRNSIASRTFSVTVTATDAQGASDRATITWTVRDTHRTMPNYIGQYGCEGCGGLPDVARISRPGFLEGCQVGGNGDRIVRQSVSAGAVIAWGQSITYWYGYDRAC